MDNNGSSWSKIVLGKNYDDSSTNITCESTDIKVTICNVYFQKKITKLWLAQTWVQFCLSLDTVSIRIVLVVDGGEGQHERGHQRTQQP